MLNWKICSLALKEMFGPENTPTKLTMMWDFASVSVGLNTLESWFLFPQVSLAVHFSSSSPFSAVFFLFIYICRVWVMKERWAVLWVCSFCIVILILKTSKQKCPCYIQILVLNHKANLITHAVKAARCRFMASFPWFECMAWRLLPFAFERTKMKYCSKN